MPLLKLFAILFTFVLVNGCAYVPKYSANQVPKEKCNLITKKLTLDLTRMDVNCGITPETMFGCLIGSGAVVSVSGVISGSIVIVGNTLHWAEKELSCSET